MTASHPPTTTRFGATSARGANGALVSLFRSVLAARWGVRAARSIGYGVASWFAVTAWLAAKGPEADGITADVAAAGAAVISGYAGSVVALSLAGVPKAKEAEAGARALASSRGFSANALTWAELNASIRLAAEAITFPALILSFASALLSHEKDGAALFPIFGAALFALVAAVVIGSIAFACRRWARARPRASLLAAVLLPWIASNALFQHRGGEYASIPGFLLWSFRLLTGGVI